MLNSKYYPDRNQIFCTSLDAMVPQDHLLRKVQKIIDWNYIGSLFDEFYSSRRGRPALDPIVFVKVLLIQYLYGYKSVRKTMEDIKVNVAYRWFLNLPFPEKVPSHTTISAIYTRRLKNSDVFEKIFHYIVDIARTNNLIDDETIFVDATHVKACANPNRKVKVYVKEEVSELQTQLQKELTESINQDRKAHGKKQLKKKKDASFTQLDLFDEIKKFETEMAKVEIDRTDKNRVKKLEDRWNELKEENKNNPASQEAQKWISLSKSYRIANHTNSRIPMILLNGVLMPLDQIKDPIDLSQFVIKTKSLSDLDAGWFCKGKHKFVFAYCSQTACDSNGYILSYKVFPGNIHDSKSFLDWRDLYDLTFNKIVADAAYKTPFIAHHLLGLDKTPILPYLRPKTKEGFFRKYEYAYDEYYDCYVCPESKILSYKTTNRDGYREYVSNSDECSKCPSLNKCTASKNHQKIITQHVWNQDLEQLDENRYRLDLAGIYAKRQTTIEPVFGRCKENHAFRYTNFTGIDRMTMEAAMTYSAANLKKIVLALDKREKENSPKSPIK